MSETIDFYYIPPSPPCRAVMLLAKIIGVDLNKKTVNLLAGEHLTDEYLKINPQHTVPTLVDGDLIITESRPIMTYLIETYASDDSLYPKDPKQRTLVDQRLYFDACCLSSRLVEYHRPITFGNAVVPDEEKKARLEEAFSFLNTFLENNDWVAGGQMTVADIAIIVSVSTSEAVGIDVSQFPQVADWYGKTKEALAEFDYEEIDQAGANFICELFRSKLE